MSELPNRLLPIHTLPGALPHVERSFYNAVWCAVRDRVHIGGNLRPGPGLAQALNQCIDEKISQEPRFPLPIVEFFQQWTATGSDLESLLPATVARIAVEAFYGELTAFNADPIDYQERLAKKQDA